MGIGHSHGHTAAHDGHGHSHGNGHGHSHAPASYGRAFAIGVVLNTAFVIVEVVYGLLSGSMALVADAGHNLSDVLSLLIAWGATAVILFSATMLYKWLGRSALTALERLMGMLLVAISVQMVLDGIGTYLKLQPNI